MKVGMYTTLLILTFGCGAEVHFIDEESFDFQEDLSGEEDLLAGSLALGTRAAVGLFVTDGNPKPRSWTIESDDGLGVNLGTDEVEPEATDLSALGAPDLLLWAGLSADKVGTFTLDGHHGMTSHHRVDIDVDVPDRARLVPQADLYLGADEDLAESGAPLRVVAGGTAAVQVQYFAGDTRLHGSGALSTRVDPDDGGLTVTSGGSVIENVVVTPSSPGTWTVHLTSAGEDLGSFVVEAPDPALITGLDLQTGPALPNLGGERTPQVVVATLEDGTPIQGVAPAWVIEGMETTPDTLPTGDLLLGAEESTNCQSATGTWQTLDVAVSACFSDLEVRSTDRLYPVRSMGCISAPGWPGAAGLVVVGLATLRRRNA